VTSPPGRPKRRGDLLQLVGSPARPRAARLGVEPARVDLPAHAGGGMERHGADPRTPTPHVAARAADGVRSDA